MVSVLSQQEKGQVVTCIQCSPNNECPVGTVPKSADDENNEHVPDAHPCTGPAAAEGNIEIVAKPGREGDMPAPPEFGNIPGEVGEGEVLHQVEAEKSCGADRDVGIAGKITIDLERKEECGEKQGTAGLFCGVAIDLIHNLSAVVGNNNFHEQPP